MTTCYTKEYMPFDSFEASPDDRVILHRRLRGWLTRFYELLHTYPPEQWAKRIYLESLRIENTLTESASTREQVALAGYIRGYAALIREDIRTRVRGAEQGSTEAILAAVDQAIHHLAEAVAVIDPEEEREDERPYRVPLEKLACLPGVEKRYDQEQGCFVLQVYAGDKQASIPLPSTSAILHKGGAPRIFLKLLMQANPSLIEAEVPPNDIDVIVTGPREEWQEEAVRLGADAEGIELVADITDARSLFSGRDVDLNQCFLGKDGLVFSARAARAAKTGNIEVSARNRVLYGSEVMYVDNKRLLKARGLMRVIKFVVEGKAKSFELSAVNTRVDLGVYWLLLARKFMKKARGPELMVRLGALAERLSPREHRGSMIDLLDRVHEQFPFFEFADVALSSTDVARWLAKKAMKEVDKHFRYHGSVPRAPLFSEEELALEGTAEISLDGFSPDPEAMAEVQAGWPAFLERCAERNQKERLRRHGAPAPLFFEEEE